MRVKKEVQYIILAKIKNGIFKGVLNNEKWEYIKTPDKDIIWLGKGIANITKLLRG